MERKLIVVGGLCLAAVALFAALRPARDASGRAAALPTHTTTGAETHDRPAFASDDLPLLSRVDAVGEHRLEGQVVDEDGLPAADATVAIDTHPPRTVTTEADGSFALDGLVGRRYRLVARAGGLVAGPVESLLTRESAPVILQLRRGGTVSVLVRDAATSSPLAHATVELRGVDVQETVTGPGGRARFVGVVPGAYRVAGAAPGYSLEVVPIVVAADASPEVELALRRGAPVSGVVTTPAGAPVAGARVLFEGASEWSRGADPHRDAVVSDAAGRFRFDALPPGSFRFLAQHAGHGPGHSAIVALDGRTPVEDLAIALTQGATLRGRVVDTHGQEVEGAVVRVVAATTSLLPARVQATYSDARGHFELAGLTRDPVWLAAEHEAGASPATPVELDRAPFERDVTLTLTLTQAIAGVVQDPSGAPVDGASVGAHAEPRADASARARTRLFGVARVLTDPGGRFLLRGLPAGRYRVVAAAPGAPLVTSTRAAVTASPGDTGVRLIIETPGRIVGRVAYQDGAPVQLYTVQLAGASAPRPVSSREGELTLEDVSTGPHRLTISGPGFVPRVVDGFEVGSGVTKDLGVITVRRGRYVAGVVLHQGRPVPGASVRAGSALFGDGSSLSSRYAPPSADRAQAAITDDAGRFVIHGVSAGAILIAAEHADAGRSRPLRLRAGHDSADGLVVELGPTGALAGTIRRGGRPLSQVAIGVQDQAAPGLQLGVASGPDGRFRLDHLAPGTYRLSAFVSSAEGGHGMHATVATVSPGQTTEADIDVGAGELALEVALVAPGHARPGLAFVYVAAGVLVARTADELRDAAAQTAGRYSSFALSAGEPVRFAGLAAGPYTVCAVAYPVELRRQDEIVAYGEREGEHLPAFCQAVDLQARAQQVSLPIEIPALEQAP